MKPNPIPRQDRRTLGCTLCGAERGHEPGCVVGSDQPTPRSACDRPCQSWTFATMLAETVCPCSDAQRAHDGAVVA